MVSLGDNQKQHRKWLVPKETPNCLKKHLKDGREASGPWLTLATSAVEGRAGIRKETKAWPTRSNKIQQGLGHRPQKRRKHLARKCCFSFKLPKLQRAYISDF